MRAAAGSRCGACQVRAAGEHLADLGGCCPGQLADAAEVKVPEMAAAADGLRHVAFFYRDMAHYQASLARFVQAGLACHEPVLLAIPQVTAVLRDHPWGMSGPVAVTDMTELGGNPARVIPALRAFADRHTGQRVRIFSELIWPGRSVAETCEAARHERLMDLALAGIAGTMVCPYNSAALSDSVLADAACIHPWELGPGDMLPSATYPGPGPAPIASRVPLPSPPHDAEVIEFQSDLRPVRALVAAAGQRAGLTESQVTDLIFAASEIAANTLQHTQAGGVAHAWQANGEMLCQVSDSGHIADPLAGLRRPVLNEPGGQGLWLVNQVCDLVELRSTGAGTVVRLHMRIQR